MIEKVIHAVQDFSVNIINALIEKLHLSHFYKKRPAVFIAALFSLLFVLLLSAVLLLIPKDEKKEKVITLNPDITQPFVLPKEPAMNDDYYLSRPKTEVWTEEEAEKWFIIPNESMINQLENDNDRLITNLLEASP